MSHTAKITYQLTWEEAEEILQNLLDNRTLDLHPSLRDPHLLEAESSEQKLDAAEIDERMTQYFGTPCICWATEDGMLAVTDQPVYVLSYFWDDDNSAGSEVLTVSASKETLSQLLREAAAAFQKANAGTEWDPDSTDIPGPDDVTPCYASFGWSRGYCENTHRWEIETLKLQ